MKRWMDKESKKKKRPRERRTDGSSLDSAQPAYLFGTPCPQAVASFETMVKHEEFLFHTDSPRVQLNQQLILFGGKLITL